MSNNNTLPTLNGDLYNYELALIGNTDLLGDAIAEFDADAKECLYSPEAADVTIRCYLLGSAVAEYVSAHEDEINEAAEYIERKINNEL